MTTTQSDHATETRTVTCFLCKGAGEVCAGTAGGFFDSYQEQWFPDEQNYTCPCCKGDGEVDETFCLICTENVHACNCTDEKIDTYLLASYLGAA